MSKTTIWTCDRCGYCETVDEGRLPKERDFYLVSVLVSKSPLGTKYKPTRDALWCSQCCTEMKVLPVARQAGKEAPPAPGLEDLVYEIARGAAEETMER